MSNIIFLNVPANKHDTVAKLGAQWLEKKKQWYVPLGTDLWPFRGWLQPPEPQLMMEIVAPTYLVRSEYQCPNCNKLSEAIAIAGRGYINEDNLLDDSCGVITLNIRYLPEILQQRLNQYYPYFYLDQMEQNDICYLNHCEHCHAAIDDHEMHHEVGATFFPVIEEMANEILLAPLTEQNIRLSTDLSMGDSVNLLLEHGTYANSLAERFSSAQRRKQELKQQAEAAANAEEKGQAAYTAQ